MSQLYFATSARSAVGLVRSGNEDSGVVSPRLIAVADGMGGHAAGEVASRIAITSLSDLSQVFATSDIDAESADDIYLNSIYSIDADIKEAVADNPELSGMGTTLTSLFLRDDKIALILTSKVFTYSLEGFYFIQDPFN